MDNYICNINVGIYEKRNVSLYMYDVIAVFM